MSLVFFLFELFSYLCSRSRCPIFKASIHLPPHLWSRGWIVSFILFYTKPSITPIYIILNTSFAATIHIWSGAHNIIHSNGCSMKQRKLALLFLKQPYEQAHFFSIRRLHQNLVDFFSPLFTFNSKLLSFKPALEVSMAYHLLQRHIEFRINAKLWRRPPLLKVYIHESCKCLETQTTKRRAYKKNEIPFSPINNRRKKALVAHEKNYDHSLAKVPKQKLFTQNARPTKTWVMLLMNNYFSEKFCSTAVLLNLQPDHFHSSEAYLSDIRIKYAYEMNLISNPLWMNIIECRLELSCFNNEIPPFCIYFGNICGGVGRSFNSFSNECLVFKERSQEKKAFFHMKKSESCLSYRYALTI